MAVDARGVFPGPPLRTSLGIRNPEASGAGRETHSICRAREDCQERSSPRQLQSSRTTAGASVRVRPAERGMLS